MAGNIDKIDKVLDDMVKDVEQVMSTAMKSIGKTAKKDFRDQANKVVKNYYKQYSPKSYDREMNLYNTFKPYYSITSGKNGDYLHIGVTFSPDALSGKYTSHSKYHQEGDKWIIRGDKTTGQFGQVEPDWVFENMFEGIHPISRKVGNTYEYTPKQDSTTLQGLMDAFIDDYSENRMSVLLQEAIIDQINARLK